MIVSVIFHALLILLLFYVMAWRAPNPPLEEYGIEVNFGVDATGGGEVQTKAVANESTNREDSKPATTAPEPTKAEAAPQPTVTQPEAKPALATDNDNEVVVKKEVVKPTPEPPKEVVKKEVAKPTPEPPKEEVKVVEKPKALYTGKTRTSSAGSGTAGTSDKPTGNSNGDDAGAVGDKGSPEGKMEAKNLYGKPGGGGGGPSLNMPGWRYDVRPKEDPYENESGKIVFRITIDANGEIENIQVVESNVSPQVVKWYRDEVFKTSFSRTSSKTPTDKGASGTITFIIRSR